MKPPSPSPAPRQARAAATPVEWLRRAGLRITAQRLAVARALIDGGQRHISAEQLFTEVHAGGTRIAQATIYNTLHQFKEAGFLREVVLDSVRTYFDTNIDPHHHFFDAANGQLIDIPTDGVTISGLPPAPPGTVLESVEIVLKIKSKQNI